MKLTALLIILVLGAVGCATAGRSSVGVAKLPESPKVYFGFNQTAITPKDQQVLESVASVLRRKDKALAILVGHTDLVGSDYYNEVLAEDRARSVRVYLRDLGVDPERTTILSKGKREPEVKRISPQANQANRRVEIVLTMLGNQANRRVP